MNTYKFRYYTGPTTVQVVAERMRSAAAPWQHVTIEGTEHIHVTIDALHVDAAWREIASWPTRANLPSLSGTAEPLF